MKRFLMALLLSSVPLFADGTVRQSLTQLGNTNSWVISYTWTGDASTGTVPITAAALNGCNCQGYLFTQVEVVPSSPAPTAGYSVAILDSGGADVLDGAAASLSASSPQAFAAAASATPLQGTFRLSISGQSVASAKGTVYVFLSKPGTVNLATLGRGSGGSTSTANWLTLANPPFADARRYNWTPQSPGGTISAGAASVTLTPCPSGITALSVTLGAAVRISGGTGTAESPVLTSYAATTSGCAIGFTAANTHSGSFAVGPASYGIQEAAIANPTGIIYMPAGTYSITAPVIFPTTSSGLLGAGGETLLTVDFDGADVLTATNASAPFRFSSFYIQHSGSAMSAGAMLYFTTSDGYVDHVEIRNAYTGIAHSNANSGFWVESNIIVCSFRGVSSLNGGAHITNNTILGTQNLAGVIAGSAAIYLNGLSPVFVAFNRHDSGVFNTGIDLEGTGDAQIFGNYVDNYTGEALTLNGTSNGRIIGNKFVANGGPAATGIHVWPTSNGNINITGNTVAFNVSNGAYAGINLEENASGPNDVLVADNQIYGLDSFSMGNAGGVGILFGGSGHGMKRVVLNGNKIGLGVEGITPQIGISFLADTIRDNLTVTGNQINAVASQIVFADIPPATSFVIGNNGGVDSVIGITASAATLVFPIQPNFTVTGSTAATAISGVMWQGRRGSLTPVDATISFTVGATIGNSFIALKNVPVTYYFDGTKLWLGGGAPIVQTGTCTLGTNCAVTFPVAFTGSTTYQCAATDQTAAAAVKVVNTSASVATFTGTGTDLISYVCTGN